MMFLVSDYFSLQYFSILFQYIYIVAQHNVKITSFLLLLLLLLYFSQFFLYFLKKRLYMNFLSKSPVDDVFSFRLFFPSVSELLLYFVLKETTI